MSFEVNGRTIVLFEHQSTENQNMPLRCLSYIARLYDTIVPAAKRYTRKRYILPTPQFYVFYNGDTDIAAESEMNLRDAFMEQEEQPDLDLKVHVYRISGQETLPIVDKCDILKEYCQFVDIVNEYSISGDPDSYERAVKEAIRRGILKEYLERKGTEVLNMFYGKYDYETDIRVQREEARDEGKQEGIAIGMEKGISLGKQEGKIEVIELAVNKMLSSGMSISQVSSILDLPLEKVESIMNEGKDK